MSAKVKEDLCTYYDVYYHCSGPINLFLCYQFEPIYGTPYQETNLSSTLVDYWRTGNNETTPLHLPGTNQFFPKDLNVLEAPENASKIPVDIPIDGKYDHRLQENTATSSIPLFHPQTILVSRCGGCRTQSSMSLVSTCTVISTHQMLRTLQHGLVGSDTTMHSSVAHSFMLWHSVWQVILYGKSYNFLISCSCAYQGIDLYYTFSKQHGSLI